MEALEVTMDRMVLAARAARNGNPIELVATRRSDADARTFSYLPPADLRALQILFPKAAEILVAVIEPTRGRAS